MAFLNPAVAEGIRLVVRQAATSAASTILTDPNTVPPSISTPPPTLVPTQSTTVTSISSTSAETTANGPPGPGSGNGPPGGNNNNSQGNNSSPLLFFVALGFGVVFTNLWIIVGVKYCFRYNARSRQMRLNEDGEPINMENMPRPHRRRREKKLMTMDEVNEKFPMLKYKNWVASRAEEGLPTRGGVLPPSRPGSVRDVDGVAPELPSKELTSTEDRPTTSAAGAVTEKQMPKHAPKESTSSTVNPPLRTSTDANPVPTVSEPATLSKDPNRASHDDDEEDDEHINAALPPECMGTSGDTCAICIDTLEDDDDVRGLTCGHAFHAVCLDPWLTSRRACCPLCKADYYTPKPRPPAAETGESSSPGVITVTLPNDRNTRMNLPGRPRHAFFGIGRGGRPALGPHYVVANQANFNTYAGQPSPHSSNASSGGFFGRWRRGTTSVSAPASSSPVPTRTPAMTTRPQPGGLFSTFRSAFPAFRMAAARGASQPPVASGANPAVSPSNLEAGVRS